MKLKPAASALGDFVRQRRGDLGLTQEELAARVPDLTRSTVAAIERQASHRLSAKVLLALSQALNANPDELYRAAGFRPVGEEREETWEELYEKVRLRAPRSIPVFATFPARGEMDDIVGRVYRAPSKRSRSIVAYQLKEGFPEALDIDGSLPIAIVNSELPIGVGSWVLCTFRGAVRCGKVRDVGGENWVQTDAGPIRLAECEHPVKVIEFALRLEEDVTR